MPLALLQLLSEVPLSWDNAINLRPSLEIVDIRRYYMHLTLSPVYHRTFRSL